MDASRLTAASETKLGLTCDSNDLTEFPMLEEGVLLSASRRESYDDTAHGFLLGMFRDAFCLTQTINISLCLLNQSNLQIQLKKVSVCLYKGVLGLVLLFTESGHVFLCREEEKRRDFS